jgi:hypothetical protein
VKKARMIPSEVVFRVISMNCPPFAVKVSGLLEGCETTSSKQEHEPF